MGQGTAVHAETTSASWFRVVGVALRRRFSVDTRALAAFRIAAGTLVLADLLILRAPDVVAFYTDAGVLPAGTLATDYPVLSKLTVHTLAGSALGQALLIALGAALAVALLVGVRTRAATVGTWLMLVSLQARNPHVINGGDTLLLVLLFFGIFLPLGERWSLDALSSRSPGGTVGGAPSPRRVASVATMGMLLQVVVVYASNVAFKMRSAAWTEGEAVRYVLAAEDWTVLLGDHLSQLPGLLVALNWVWLALLVASPLLVLLTGWPRATVVAAFATVHLGMLVTLDIGLFSLVSIAALLPFLPPVGWDRLGAKSSSTGARGPPSPDGDRGSSDRPERTEGVGPRPSSRARSLVSVGLALVLVTGALWHASAVGLLPQAPIADDAGRIGEHRWDMFAPHPPTTTDWYVAEATLTTGGSFDALQLAPVDWSPPEDASTRYPSTLWHRYFDRLSTTSDAGEDDLAAYLCRRAAGHAEASVASVSLYRVQQPIALDGPDPPPQRQHVHTRSCR